MARKKSPPPGAIERLKLLLGTTAGAWLTRIGIGAIVFLGVGLIVSQARAQAYALADFRITPASVRLGKLPTWANGPVGHSLSAAGLTRYGGAFSVSVYDPDAEGLIVERLERHPLVRRVKSVKIRYPNEAIVDISLRVPVARVSFRFGSGKKATEQHAYLSDDGCLLTQRPYMTYVRGLRRPLPKAVGIRTRPPLVRTKRGWSLAIGVPWDDKDERVGEMLAAAELSERIFREFRGHVIVNEIDVRRFHPDGRSRDQYSEVRLKALCPPEVRGGPRVTRIIEWGRTEQVGRPVVGEETSETKLRRLRAQLIRSPVPRPVDVRWWDDGAVQ